MLAYQNTSKYIILREFASHFHIYADVTGSKGDLCLTFVWHKKWGEYFFANLDGLGAVIVNDKLSVDEL